MSFARRGMNFVRPSSVSSVGQRRPPGGPNNAFGNQGQLNRLPQTGFQNKQPVPPQQQQVQQAQQQFHPAPQQVAPQRANPQVNQMKPPPLRKPHQQPQVEAVQQAPLSLQQAAEQLVMDQSVPPEGKSQPVANTNPVPAPLTSGVVEGGESPASDQPSGTVPTKQRPFWMKRNGRVNRAERAKRRNTRMRKLLQPKNALMIINELVGHVQFDVSDGLFNDLYKANVAVEGDEHIGYGKSKALAKAAAAEAAVRHMIMKKLKISADTSMAKPEEENPPEDMRMEVTVTEEAQEDVSWTHIASFAIHKLFAGWGDDGAEAMSRANSTSSLDKSGKESLPPGMPTQPEQKPAKKLPENAALMNPIMLLNQMQPSAKYEELGKSGVPPHILFSIKCTVGTQSFLGTGSNKKAARKQAAFEACKALLGIQYSPDILQGTSTDNSYMV